MRRVLLAASLTAAWALYTPNLAAAQEPEPAPVRKPPSTATAEPSRARSTAGEVAVPRSEAPRGEKARTERSGGETRLSEASRVAPTANVNESDDQGAQRRGAVRRPPSDGGGRGGDSQAPRDRAVARTSPPPRDYDGRRNRDRIYYYPSYYSYGRYYDPYYYDGFHLGYLAYSPWGWTPAFYGYPYGYGGGNGYGYGRYRGDEYGALRIKVKPRDAEVYVDGYFAGNVDDFDGVFQSLKLETGGYKVEIRKPGFETLVFDVHVQPDRTITYRGEMNSATP
jgi:hypothetical protein